MYIRSSINYTAWPLGLSRTSNPRQGKIMKDSELVAQLTTFVGPTLVAIASSTADRNNVNKWIAGDLPLTTAQRTRLEVALECLALVTEVESKDVARAWFIGSNTGIAETSPCEALCSGEFEEVRLSAKRLVDFEQMGA